MKKLFARKILESFGNSSKLHFHSYFNICFVSRGVCDKLMALLKNHSRVSLFNQSCTISQQDKILIFIFLNEK